MLKNEIVNMFIRQMSSDQVYDKAWCGNFGYFLNLKKSGVCFNVGLLINITAERNDWNMLTMIDHHKFRSKVGIFEDILASGNFHIAHRYARARLLEKHKKIIMQRVYTITNIYLVQPAIPVKYYTIPPEFFSEKNADIAIGLFKMVKDRSTVKHQRIGHHLLLRDNNNILVANYRKIIAMSAESCIPFDSIRRNTISRISHMRRSFSAE